MSGYAQVRDLMLDGKWRSIPAIARRLEMLETTVSARLRELRGRGFSVKRRFSKSGGNEYRVTRQKNMFEAGKRKRKCRCPSCGGRGWKWGT